MLRTRDIINSQNILFFTVHKAASMFIYKVCHDLAKESGLNYYSVNRNKRSKYYFDTEEKDLSDLAVWEERRGCFAPLRYYFEIPDELDAKVILHLRDPRDVLVSLYFSEAFSHSVYRGVFDLSRSERTEIRDRGIDQYVLAHAADFNDKYTEYQALMKKNDTVFVRYEDLVLNFDLWIKDVARAFGVERDNFIKRMIVKYEKDFMLKQENIHSHKRKILPGDHKEKLQERTINMLNEIFSENLKFYKYEL